MKSLSRSDLAFPLSARWSGRAFTGEALTGDELNLLCAAVRWAPSSGNRQPWRCFVTLAGTETFRRANAEVLDEGNRIWCARAGALFVMASGVQLSPNYKFDCGLATENLLLQATAMGLIGHPIGGFDPSKAVEVLRMGDGLEPLCVVAVGRPDVPESLPTETLRQRERSRSDRKPLEEIIFVR